MAVKVGINGFGRIGRVVFRTCLLNSDIELSAINDPAITAEYICYLIKFDSTHGKFDKNVTYSNDEITVEDRIIKVFHEKLPSSVPWQNAGVQYVIEASGMFTNLDKASGHMQGGGVKRVIVTAPSVDVPMIILGVNDFRLRPEQKVMSCASSTLYCLAPIIKVLEDHYGIAEGFVTSIHAMTPSLKPLDGLCLRGKHWRDHRSIHQNIIPATTGACKALAKIIPQVKDKLSGLAFRVPIVNVSVLDITIRLNRNTSLQDIVKNIEKAGNASLKNIIKISYEETVSSDYIGENHSCIFDAESSLQLKSNFYKLICWYENEYSYACRVIDSIFYSERQLSLTGISSKMTYVRAKPSKKYDEIQQTECVSKEISIECKYNSDLSCTTTLETGFQAKDPVKVALLKKPLSEHISGIASSSASGREMKRRNEIFKIWNDNNDISKSCVRQNRGSFFHSCISFTPKNVQVNHTVKANDRIKTIKRDISKMTHMTDDLLTKPRNDKIEAESDIKNSTENSHLSGNECIEEPTRDCHKKTHKFINNMRTFDICGDGGTNIKVNDSKILEGCSKEELIRTYDSYNKVTSDCNIVTKENLQNTLQLDAKIEPQNNTQISSLQEVTQNLRSGFQRLQDVENESKTFINNNAFKEQVAKAINTLIEGLEQSFQVTCQCGNQEKLLLNSIQRKEILAEKYFNETNDISKVNKEKCIHYLKTQNENLSHNSNTGIHNDFNEVMDLDVASKILCDEDLNGPVNNNEFVCNPVVNNLIIESEKEGTYFAKQILDGLNRFSPEPIVMIREEQLTSSSPDSGSVSCKDHNVRLNKLDIYDKLESRSGSDSENSFEIHGRKSQIIHIADLTKSLEDLDNLDKICRIIEISDELSDKLFSALSETDGKAFREKKWSFKDLCERIKLDEFCSQVFGKTAL